MSAAARMESHGSRLKGRWWASKKGTGGVHVATSGGSVWKREADGVFSAFAQSGGVRLGHRAARRAYPAEI